jgi:hypothetical protein
LTSSEAKKVVSQTASRRKLRHGLGASREAEELDTTITGGQLLEAFNHDVGNATGETEALELGVQLREQANVSHPHDLLANKSETSMEMLVPEMSERFPDEGGHLVRVELVTTERED